MKQLAFYYMAFVLSATGLIVAQTRIIELLFYFTLGLTTAYLFMDYINTEIKLQKIERGSKKWLK